MFDLGDYYLLSHLRMEGKYFFKQKEERMALGKAINTD